MIPVADYLDNNGLATAETSDVLIVKAVTRAQLDADRRFKGQRNKSVS